MFEFVMVALRVKLVNWFKDWPENEMGIAFGYGKISGYRTTPRCVLAVLEVIMSLN
jgi:hypothetical protein